jgi:hypothetical protein
MSSLLSTFNFDGNFSVNWPAIVIVIMNRCTAWVRFGSSLSTMPPRVCPRVPPHLIDVLPSTCRRQRDSKPSLLRWIPKCVLWIGAVIPLGFRFPRRHRLHSCERRNADCAPGHVTVRSESEALLFERSVSFKGGARRTDNPDWVRPKRINALARLFFNPILESGLRPC